MQPPTKEFLNELVERARRYGWSGDYVEIRDFLAELFRDADLTVPDLEPYPICPHCDRIEPDCQCVVSQC